MTKRLILGFHATTVAEYARAFTKALTLPPDEILAMRRRARASAKRFTEEAFAERWVVQMKRLIDLTSKGASGR